MHENETSKADVLKYLLAEGYDANIADGVVYVHLPEEEYISKGGKTLRKLRKELEGIGYTGSIGVAPKGVAK